MGLLRHILWSSRRFLSVLIPLVVLGGYIAWKKACARGEGIYCDFKGFGAQEAIVFIIVIWIIIFLPRIVGNLFYKHDKGSFKDDPHLYHGKIVRFTGRVEHIIENTTGQAVKRKIVDAYRTATGNDDSEGRYIHQRFLLSSPSFRRNQVILVEHNVQYGTVPLRKRQRVIVQGEYIHPETLPRGKYYGKIHFTHKPKGYIEYEL